ncbi:MAG: MarR family transcriptional regulator [Anaeromicrobium sp.]|jgi:MarR family 2-MHQ and catechol resistance regulon transcriptional repressor|uniref:MarR family winged helix-turn-helix transcriptional regulator n=1 Tax=Anaeromicrobium sp. TaxID=1929132 RepID=UPI0025D3DBED|nr:MarR family transcriptional regulator [Anaeromicrobium sp.]MCT4592738.1 MarR family transcriptional regulator [Anaeromicrobium sp.]
MEKLQKLSEHYKWAQFQSTKVALEIKKTTEMIEYVHSNFFEKYGTTNTKFNVLVILSRGPKEGMMLSEIGEKMVVTKANMTGLIDRLEKDGLVERIRDSKDRRKIRAVLTTKGKDFVEKLVEVYSIWIKTFMDGYQKETEQIFSLMKLIQDRTMVLNESI